VQIATFTRKHELLQTNYCVDDFVVVTIGKFFRIGVTLKTPAIDSINRPDAGCTLFPNDKQTSASMPIPK
jgi:hypothetical protein